MLATKVGMEMAPDKKGLSAEYITEAVEDSLRRLKTDHIDLYQSHKDDETVPLEETLQAYQKLIQAGKVRSIGASNYSAERLEKALKISKSSGLPSYVSMQPQYNLVERLGFESKLESVCEKNHVGVISYFSLANGFLSGKYRSIEDLKKSARGDRVKKYLDRQGLQILAALDEISEHHKCSQAAIALAWIMARKSITAPIASATNLDQLKDLVKSVEVKLSPEEMKKLDACSAGSDHSHA